MIVGNNRQSLFFVFKSEILSGKYHLISNVSASFHAGNFPLRSHQPQSECCLWRSCWWYYWSLSGRNYCRHCWSLRSRPACRAQGLQPKAVIRLSSSSRFPLSFSLRQSAGNKMRGRAYLYTTQPDMFFILGSCSGQITFHSCICPN